MDTIKLKRLIAFLLSITIVFSFIPNENRIYVNAATPKLNKKSATVYVGDSIHLKVKNNKKKVKWYSSDEEVVEVDSSGNVYANKPGTVTITAKVKSKKYKCKIYVPQPSLALDKYSLNVQVGSVTEIKATCKKYSGYVSWQSSDESVATVTGGYVKALKSGNAIITAKIDGGQWAKCNVFVSGSNMAPSTTSVDYSKPTIDQQVEITTTEAKQEVDYEIEYLADKQIIYDTNTQVFELRFTFLKNDEMTMTYGVGTINVSIINSANESVYNNVFSFNESSFEKMDTNSGKKLYCRIFIPCNQIAKGKSSTGCMKFTVKGNNFSFNEITMDMSRLPSVETTQTVEKIATTETVATTQVYSKEELKRKSADILKKYILSHGEYDKDLGRYGVQMIYTVNDHVLYSTIGYCPSDDSFKFDSAYVGEEDGVGMVVNGATVRFKLDSSNDVCVGAYERISDVQFNSYMYETLESIKDDNSFEFYTEEENRYLSGNTRKSMSDSGNYMLNIGCLTWEKYLYNNLGMHMSDLGFTGISNAG